MLTITQDITPIGNFVLGLGVVWLISEGCMKFWTFSLEGDAEVFLLTS